MFYEADNVEEAMMVYNRRFILVSPLQQPRKQVRSVQVQKIVTTVTYGLFGNVNRLYDAVDQHLLDVLLEISKNLMSVASMTICVVP